MKLILQIATGVFFGVLCSQLVLDQWHSYRNGLLAEAEQKRLAEDEKANHEQLTRIREYFQQAQGKLRQP